MKKILVATSTQIALLSALILIGMLCSLNPWEHLETTHYDFWAHHFRSPQDQTVVIVAIDEKSIRELGDWPWPRSRMAEMVRHLTAQGAASLGICPLYIQPHTDPALSAIREMKQQVGDRKWRGGKKAARIVQGMMDSAQARLDQDAPLITAVRRARNVVLPLRFTKGRQAATDSDKMSGMLIVNSMSPEKLVAQAGTTPQAEAEMLNRVRKDPITATGVWETFDELASKASALGHLNLDADQDGLYRRLPLLIEYKDRLFPAMSLQLAIKYLEVGLKDLTIGRNFFGQPCLRIKHLEVTTDDAYRILMNYDRQWTMERTYSFVDVLHGSLDPAIFRNKIVLIGATGEGMAPVYRIGPHDQASSVEITANVLVRILSTVRLSRPSWARTLEIVALLYFAFFLIFVIPRVDTKVGALILGVFLVTWYILGLGLLLGYGYWIKPFGPAVLACSGFVLTVAAGYARRWRFEVLDANKTLGLHYQGQGLLDMAYDRFIKCPVQDATVKDLLYNLGLDFERKRMFEKALMIYRMIGKYGPFKDIEKRSNRLASPDNTTALPVHDGSVNSAPLMVDNDIKPIFGRYEILRELGRGSMGTVYLGRDPKINREVAIKTLKYADVGPGDLDWVKTRFFREAEAAGKLSHPNIVSIYDVGEDHDIAYMAMELLNGHDLTRFCMPEHLLPACQVLPIIAEVAAALDYAHNQGVVHRDIKPANIMLLEDGRIKVTDFGIALVVDASKTRTGMVLGTPTYMSPEQVDGQVLDGRSDLFSLGIIFYELLAGTKPFNGNTISTILHAITHKAYPPLSEFKRDIPACCQTIIDKLLVKELDKRFDSAAQLSKEIESCLAELPNSVPDESVDVSPSTNPEPEPGAEKPGD